MPNGRIKYLLYQWIDYPVIASNNASAIIYDGENTSFDSKNLEENQNYYYQVVPYNIKYKLTGPGSIIINGTTHEDGKS